MRVKDLRPRPKQSKRGFVVRLSDTELLYLPAESIKRLSIADDTLQNTKQECPLGLMHKKVR